MSSFLGSVKEVFNLAMEAGKNPWQFIKGAFILLFCAGIVWSFYRFWGEIQDLKQHDARAISAVEFLFGRKENDKGHSLEFRLATDKAINRELQALLGETGASRAGNHLFHNGTRSLAGYSFLKTSETHEVVAPGVSAEINNMQNLPLHVVYPYLSLFMDHECSDNAVATLHDAALKSVLEAQGVKRSIVCPVYLEGRKEPAGFVGIDFTHDVGNDLARLDKVRLRAEQIGILIRATID